MRKHSGGRQRRPIPADFAANAGRRNAELTVLYGVSEGTVSRWRHETGLPGTRGRGPQKAKFNFCDSDEEIRACLSCPALSCSSGDCARRKSAAM